MSERPDRLTDPDADAADAGEATSPEAAPGPGAADEPVASREDDVIVDDDAVVDDELVVDDEAVVVEDDEAEVVEVEAPPVDDDMEPVEALPSADEVEAYETSEVRPGEPAPGGQTYAVAEDEGSKPDAGEADPDEASDEAMSGLAAIVDAQHADADDIVSAVNAPRPRVAGAPSGGRKKAKPASGIQKFATFPLITVGLLMLIPAIWSVMVLNGQEAPGSDRPDARNMAYLMLVCWPIAILLLGAGGTFLVQTIMSGGGDGKAKRR